MVIAVDTRSLSGNRQKGSGNFAEEVLKRIVTQHPGHQFHFFFNQPFNKNLLFADNVFEHLLSSPSRHRLLRKWWYDVKVSTVVKKVKAEVFLSLDGRSSLRTKVPQCLLVQDLAFNHYPKNYTKLDLWYYKWDMAKATSKAKVILATSEFLKQDLLQHYKVDPEKITVVYKGVKESFVPTNYDQQQLLKEKFTGGAEFFLYAGTIQPQKNLIHLLKAFSIFKRRLHSSMKLVLAGKMEWKNNEFLNLLETYKYKEDVVLTGYLKETELATLMASAYAFVYPSLFEGFGTPIVEAARCGVPVLTSNDSAMQEISNGAALYFDPQNVDDIADKLMMIYKDETGRKSLMEKGLIVSQRYTWERTAEKVWESLVNIANT